ncbi:MAG: insulinase family protein [Planctomycetes bacterium]|nr:insulinase family protein [Planctomycetota bacterium]
MTHTIPGLRSCAIGALLDVGPRDEPIEMAGLAHLTEHLMFEGTSNRDGLAIARLIDSLGGQVGGFITRDYTCYAATVLDEYAPYVLDLFGDLLLNSTFPEECVAAQRGAIGRELATLADQPDRLVNDCLKSLVWPDHPLGRPVAGQPDTVSKLTREDVIYFTHRTYLPDRLIVAAAGGVDHDDFVAQVRDGFWRMIGQAGPRQCPRPQYRGGVVVKTHPVNQAYFALAIPAPVYASPDRYGWHLLTTILGGGISSRLFRDVRETRGLAFHIAAEYQAYADAGLLVIEGATAPEDLMKVVSLSWDSLCALASGTDPITTEELWRAKMQLRGQHLLGGQDASTLFSRLVTQELYFGHAIPTETLQREIESVDVDSLAGLAGRLNQALRFPALVVVAPETPHITRETLQDLLIPASQSFVAERTAAATFSR